MKFNRNIWLSLLGFWVAIVSLFVILLGLNAEGSRSAVELFIYWGVLPPLVVASTIFAILRSKRTAAVTFGITIAVIGSLAGFLFWESRQAQDDPAQKVVDIAATESADAAASAADAAFLDPEPGRDTAMGADAAAEAAAIAGEMAEKAAPQPLRTYIPAETDQVVELQPGENTFKGYRCADDCSGHIAGYEWARDNKIEVGAQCERGSVQFSEGCFAYLTEQLNNHSAPSN